MVFTAIRGAARRKNVYAEGRGDPRGVGGGEMGGKLMLGGPQLSIGRELQPIVAGPPKIISYL